MFRFSYHCECSQGQGDSAELFRFSLAFGSQDLLLASCRGVRMLEKTIVATPLHHQELTSARLHVRVARKASGRSRLAPQGVTKRHKGLLQGLCDVFLDSPLYNGQRTVLDSLWAGVPVVTLPAVRPYQRVAASYLMRANQVGAVDVIIVLSPVVS